MGRTNPLLPCAALIFSPERRQRALLCTDAVREGGREGGEEEEEEEHRGWNP